MKRLLLVLVLASSAFGDQISVGPNGINSTITGLNGSSPLTEAIVIGQAEDYRAGKPDYDSDPIFYASDTRPYGVWYGSVGSAPGVNLFSRDHPTEVAGVMIGRSGDIPGVAPAARLHSLAFSDIEDPSGVCVALQSLAKTAGMKAINNSWSEPTNFLETNGRSLVSQFMDWSAKKHDVLYVVAGGNIPDFDRYPADIYNGISVAASAPDMNGVYDEFSYVNRDPTLRDQNFYDRSYIDIMAPGESVLVQSLNDQNFLRDGTSYAAPHVTGTIALLW